MNSREDLYKANAIRVLSKIIDSTMLGAIERCESPAQHLAGSRGVATRARAQLCVCVCRYMKQAIVDKNPLVSSSALVAGMHLMGKSPEIVRRWWVPSS
jgi:coatomer protein complex subunit gamma